MNDDVKAYLVHSYLYYKLDSSVISDTEYDALCKKLLDTDEYHPLIDREALAAGSGYSISEYPPEIIEEAERLLEESIPGKPAGSTEVLPFELKITGTPVETYLLLGMYIDYGFSKQRDIQATIRKELQLRWESSTHLPEFNKYFEHWSCGPERFGLK